MNNNLLQMQNISNNSNDNINNKIGNFFEPIQLTNTNLNTISSINVYITMTIEEYNIMQKNKNYLIRENTQLKKENEDLTEEITEEINNLQKQIFELNNKIKNLQKKNTNLIKRISML